MAHEISGAVLILAGTLNELIGEMVQAGLIDRERMHSRLMGLQLSGVAADPIASAVLEYVAQPLLPGEANG